VKEAMSAFPTATRATILTGALFLFHASAGWSAQVVALVNGSRLEVESYRMEGPRIIFTLSGPGEGKSAFLPSRFPE
jgi:hypothetical protein